MSSPLIKRLTDELGYPTLTSANFDSYINAQPFTVLFFADDPKRFPESVDVAVILPELIKRFSDLSPALMESDLERELRGRYNFTVWPALVFLKEGRYLGAITKVQNWDDYLVQIERILAKTPTIDPGIGTPVVFNPVSTSCSQ